MREREDTDRQVTNRHTVLKLHGHVQNSTHLLTFIQTTNTFGNTLNTSGLNAMNLVNAITGFWKICLNIYM